MRKTVLFIGVILITALACAIPGCSSNDGSTKEEVGNGFLESQILVNLESESQNVHLAMTALMVGNVVSTVKPQTTWTNDLSGSITEGSSGSLKYYMDEANATLGYYQWDSKGKIYQCRDASCPDPF